MTTEKVFERLRELQDVLTQKITLEKEMEDIPKILSSSEELVYRLKQDYIDKDQEYVAAKKKENEFRNAFFIAESDREKSEKKMDSASTQREIEALNKEIEDAARKEDSNRKELHLMEQKVAELNEVMQLKKEFMDTQMGELTERKKNIEKELAEKRKRLDAVTLDEKRLTDGLDSELIFKFERIIRKKKGRGVVAVKGREHPVCQSCHMILPIQFAAEIRKGVEVLSCPYCSSILFYEEAEDSEEEFFDDGDAGSLADLDDIGDELEEEEEEEVVNIDYES
ncbi:MAG: C4-type zinc ribbon domain-containing protein [Spirochaetaceae bacterium]|jgi:predicted  nucleic acid-binding Zn-ribbon protein|nr:C4-type zinc ribbon domain-containing protein [Spirochaetaceae bacterium]